MSKDCKLPEVAAFEPSKDCKLPEIAAFEPSSAQADGKPCSAAIPSAVRSRPSSIQEGGGLTSPQPAAPTKSEPSAQADGGVEDSARRPGGEKLSLNSVSHPELRRYWEHLVRNLELLSSGSGIALAFSGGMDSLVLLQICRRLGLDVLAVHGFGPQFSSGHSRQAVRWLEQNAFSYQLVQHNALELPELRCSDKRRCYYCKSRLITRLREAGGQRNLCDGTHAGDLHGYRPGLQALREGGVHSPLLEAGLDKALIRSLAEALGLELPQSGGQNCLLTRFEYGVNVDEARLRGIEELEEAVLVLLRLAAGPEAPDRAPQCRLRYLADPERAQGARAELHIESSQPLPVALRGKAAALLARHGFTGAPILTMPKVSGYFDANF